MGERRRPRENRETKADAQPSTLRWGDSWGQRHCKVSSERIDNGRLLPDEQMACTMKHQAALLLGRLRRDEPHVCSRDRFADCFRVGRIVLLPLDVRLYVSRRHKPHGMPKRLQFTRPIM